MSAQTKLEIFVSEQADFADAAGAVGVKTRQAFDSHGNSLSNAGGSH